MSIRAKLKKGTLSYTTSENLNLYFYLENDEIVSVNILNAHRFCPSKSTSSNFPRKSIGQIQAKINILRCFAVLFMIARFLSIWDILNKSWYII